MIAKDEDGVNVDYTDDGPIFHKTDIRTARGNHKCSECRVIKNLGEKYDNFWSITPDIPESCISALTPQARAKVCEYIEECWEND